MAERWERKSDEVQCSLVRCLLGSGWICESMLYAEQNEEGSESKEGRKADFAAKLATHIGNTIAKGGREGGVEKVR